MRFSLLTLMAAVLIAAVGCAAIANPSQMSAMAVGTTAILLLLGAVVAAIYCRAAARAFWTGFAILGWGYVLLVWACFNELSVNREDHFLATAWVLDELAEATLDPLEIVDVADPFAEYAGLGSAVY